MPVLIRVASWFSEGVVRVPHGSPVFISIFRSLLRHVLGLRSYPVPSRWSGVLHPVVVLGQLKIVALTVRAHDDMPDTGQESSHVRNAQSPRSYEGREHPAKPAAPISGMPR
jgi:hypothetical protein